MSSKLKRASGIVLLICGCRGSTTNIGAYLAELPVQATAGGTLLISAQDDPQLAGTSITVAAGALEQDTTITIATSTTPVALPGASPAGPVLTFGPVGTPLRSPLTISLPFALSGTQQVSQLFVEEVDGSGDHQVFLPDSLAIDTDGAVVGFSVGNFGTFGAVTGASCEDDSTCQADDAGVCAESVCTGDLQGEGLRLACGVNANCLLGEACDAGRCVSFGDGG